MKTQRQRESKLTNALPRRAQAALRARRHKELRRHTAAGVGRLVHGQEVHQVKPEMQNEELRRAQVELAQLRNRLRELYDFAPVGYVTLDARATVLEVNLKAARMLGVGHRNLVGQRFTRFVTHDSQDALYLHCQQVLANEKSVACELTLRRSDGTTFPVRLEGIPFTDASQNRRCQAALIDITAQRQAEEATRASEEKYRLLFELNPNPMWIFDETTLQFLAVNKAAVKLYGWSRAEFLRLTVKDILPPEEMPKLARQRGSRATLLGEWRHWKKDGTILDVEVTIGCLQFQGRDAPLAMVHNITDRKQAEAALRESEARHWELFESMFDGYAYCQMLFDEEGRPDDFVYLAVNTAFERLTGLKNVVGKRVTQIIPRIKDQNPELFEIYGRVASTGKPERLEINFKPLSLYLFVSVYSPTKGRFVAIFDDITARKQAEAALRESEANFRSYFENVAVGTAQLDRKGRFIRVNDRFCEITGYSRKELLGGLGPLDLDHSDDCEADRKRLAPFLRGKRRDYEIEKRYVRKDGGVVWVHVSAALVRDEAGQIFFTAGVIEDITERKQAEAALRKLTDDLELRVTERTAELKRANTALLASEERFRRNAQELGDFFESSPIGLLWVGADGCVLRVNREGLALLGRRLPNCRRPVGEFFADPELVADLLKRLAHRETVQNFRARLRNGNGFLKHVLIDANGLWDRGHLVHSRWFIRDITQRVELEREIIAISEREQRRIGQDLHDDLCSQLTGIQYLSETLAGDLADLSPERRDQAKEIGEMIQRAMLDARSLAQGLFPLPSGPDGLMAGLEALAVRTTRVFRRDCAFHCPALVLVPDTGVATHLYRIAQEAVGNAIKHGKARCIEVCLAANGDDVVLGVNDDGLGVPRKLPLHKGLGLRIMQYRAGLIEGSLVVRRRRHGGTEVVCTVRGGSQPIKPSDTP